MWYSVLGGKEILQRTFKNLDQRVQLECDGQRIPLPSLQGIVILNIPRLVCFYNIEILSLSLGQLQRSCLFFIYFFLSLFKSLL